jgi:predicted protein tyrosine phosphatase
MKILTICHGGNVRSRAMAYILMERHKHDALSAGAGYQKSTIEWLCDNWAERIVLMQPQFMNVIPQKHRHKVHVCDVGEDNYGSPWNFILIERCATFATNWATRGWK